MDAVAHAASAGATAPDDALAHFWAGSADALLDALDTRRLGLTGADAATRLARYGANRLDDHEQASPLKLFARQFTSPLVLILVFGAIVSAGLRDWLDAGIIFSIVVGSALMTFLQEYRAATAVAALRARLALRARVRRDGATIDLPVSDLVPGDVICLAAGNLIPADGRILAARDFLVTEASLTGESMPVEKHPGALPVDAVLAARTNCAFMGAAVRSGTAEMLVVHTGRATAFGAIADRLRRAEPETAFARGIARFGTMLLRVMLVMVIVVLAANQLLGRPFTESLLFAVALAVGLSPELLPAIISLTLSAGARDLARGGVIVRRLDSIENLGSVDVLCTDKTGTLTEGEVSLAGAIDAAGRPSAIVREAGFLNAHFESGIANPLDAALCAAAAHENWSPGGVTKSDEIPYDFTRRRLSIIVATGGARRLVTKGAYDDVLAVCSRLRVSEADEPLTEAWRIKLDALFQAQGEAGMRALAVAERRVEAAKRWTHDDERDLVFLGLLLFLDPPKADAAATIRDLGSLGIAVKVISGDNRYITRHIAEAVGIGGAAMLTGGEIAAMSGPALAQRVVSTELFVEIDPQQKERIVAALQHAGRVVAFLGDGINDAPALHAADVGISVDQATDVARASADIVLLRRDLAILHRGVIDGRRTFANTMKYISIAVSSTFGNMISMAIVTPLLPFLPLLPKQILLNNFLSDIAALTIATDRVDAERIATPHRWDVRDIRHFMIVFGLLSSCFDFATFAVLMLIVRAGETMFQTSWFVVSLMTEVLVVLVLRTQRRAFESRPGSRLLLSSVTMLVAAPLLPFVPLAAEAFGFVPIGASLLAITIAIAAGYVLATELAKRIYYRAAGGGRAGRIVR
ncbi:magnesium-translocating P-type ATPase [Hephaestia mangrovi]|uniref:magnesium-translocating P-type ATPase n=1 Tax=Hephaestia mangrovi TaxID=2873268 RepID=UPI001CA75A00|nr:magnesium-translocating P-type ATPase [Hephaestia mangrovi]MBY8829431.1 magnesium-translocating P-type ATPase [Hephaestia mangrovi]